MKKLFGLFVIGILSSTAMAELVCLAPSGCAIEIETGACPTCVENSIVELIVKNKVESIVVKQSSKTTKMVDLGNEWIEVPIGFYDETPNSCPNYFELHHGGKTCEIQRNICASSKRLCNQDFRGCKEIEIKYNKRFERNHGKRTCG